jgi:hypothetical protein
MGLLERHENLHHNTDMAIKVKACLIIYEQQLWPHDSIMHILHHPLTKENLFYITWLFKLAHNYLTPASMN